MISRHFWGWDEPVLERAVQYLLKGWTGGGLDLSERLIIVPTAEAGRRLREGLAHAAAKQGGAVMVPYVWSPEMALFPAQMRKLAASSLQSHLVWVRLLLDLRLADFGHVFPVAPPEQNWSWASSTARMLQDLQMTLGAGGLNFNDLSHAPEAAVDVERWRELAKLESLYHQVLKRMQKQDAQACKAATAQQPWWPAEVQQVQVFAVLDAPPLFGQWLKKVGAALPMEVCVHAPESLATAFDETGSPLPPFWQRADALPAPVQLRQMNVLPTATQQAELVVRLLDERLGASRIALGCCAPDVTSCIKDRLALEDVRLFEPGGVAPQSLGLWHVLECLRELCHTDSWSAFANLLRAPELRHYLTGQVSLQVLEHADKFAQEHMPITLRHALEFIKPVPQAPKPASAKRKKATSDVDQLLLPGLEPVGELAVAEVTPLHVALLRAQQLQQAFASQPLEAALRDFFTSLYGERSFTPNSTTDRSLLELCDAILELAHALSVESASFGLKPNAPELFQLLLEQVGNQKVTEPRGEVDLTLQGWLELLWESAPQLIIAGFNEEHVPGILQGHPFLPDSLREKLGLPCQATRYARDACLLYALSAQRPQPGQLQLLCGQWGERGEALKPSRLLMRGSTAELPVQVRKLFPSDEAVAPPVHPARTLAWQLRPRVKSMAEMQSISVSQLNAYLECPFRYYLTHVLHMRQVVADKREMSAAEFGSLIHVAFEKLAAQPALHDCSDVKVLSEVLTTAAELEAKRLYGKRLPVMLRLQVESALQRLRAAAEVEAVQRAEGWRTLRSELDLAREEKTLFLDGVRLHGKVDRLEQRGSLLRVIDFKTADEARPPAVVHCKEVRSAALKPGDEWKQFQYAGKNYQWLDLQLPLYAAAVAGLGYSGAGAAYLAMPKSVQDTNLLEWPEFGQEQVQAALHCATEAVRRIKAQQFWPPTQQVRYDDYQEILLGDALNAVQWLDGEV
jgi:ATP-dependent helicase/nuclease subunit B